MIDILNLASIFFFTILVLHLLLSLYYKHPVSVIIGSPFLFFSLLFSFVFLLRPYVIIFIDDSMVGEYSLTIDNLSIVLSIALTSYFIIFCIYWLFQKSVKKEYFISVELLCKNKFIIWLIFIQIVTLVIVCIDILIYGANILHAGSGGMSFIFIIFKQLLFAIITIQSFILLFYNVKPVYKYSLIMLLLLSIFVSLLAGGRGSLMYAILSISILYLYKKRAIFGFKQMVITLSISILSIIFLNILGSYRHIQLTMMKDQTLNFFDFMITFISDMNFSAMIAGFSWGFSMFDVFPKILDYYNGATYYGYTIISALIGFVPRIIWNDKPVETGTMIITTTDLYPGLYESQNTGLIGTYLGEAYSNFGFIGILIYSIIIGYLFSYYHKRALISFNIFFLPFYAIAFPYIFSIVRGGFDWVWMFVIFKLIPLTLIVYYLKKNTLFVKNICAR